ncbi:hypothetical protein QJS04_geneDACA012588 [Acorus gramineus]|uniref:Uncharacterized protein n=1 Tax=Acorus gramineus TaxID=55184 RepID=A0AAV9B2B9_ACOGR|nr:hypothetical protein QJS04_geneDACA012588 [Acorus gramineus]
MRELKAVKRQNLITHCLLSVVIVVTVVWQLSEVSFLLSMKDKVSHPIRSIWNVMEGALKGGGKIQDPNKPNNHTLIEASPLLPLSVPELPHVDLPALPFNNGQ